MTVPPESAPPAIGVAQTVPAAGDVAANVRQHLELARAAADDGAHVLVFPELSLTGYELARAAKLAFYGTADPRLEPLARAARELSLTLIVGAPARLGGALRLAAFALRADGGREVYAKRRLGAFGPGALADARADAGDGGGESGPRSFRRLPPAESSVFRAGDRDLAIDVRGARAALAICADAGDPAQSLRAAERGASIYLASIFSIPSEFERESARLRAIARDRGMRVAWANFGGPTGGLAAAGRSAVVDTKGEIQVELGPSGAGVAVVSGSG